MPRDGSATLSDLIARRHARLVIVCDTCGRRGEYDVARMMRERGDLLLTRLHDDLTADCPRRVRGPDIYQRCAARFEGL